MIAAAELRGMRIRLKEKRRGVSSYACKGKSVIRTECGLESLVLLCFDQPGKK
jgi:hypothetical protein